MSNITIGYSGKILGNTVKIFIHENYPITTYLMAPQWARFHIYTENPDDIMDVVTGFGTFYKVDKNFINFQDRDLYNYLIMIMDNVEEIVW